jgi:hypothetical protein
VRGARAGGRAGGGRRAAGTHWKTGRPGGEGGPAAADLPRRPCALRPANPLGTPGCLQGRAAADAPCRFPHPRRQAHAIKDAADLSYLVTMVTGESRREAYLRFRRLSMAAHGRCSSCWADCYRQRPRPHSRCSSGPAPRPPPPPAPLLRAAQDCCITNTQARHDAAVAMVKGYCRQRTLAELREELRGAAAKSSASGAV